MNSIQTLLRQAEAEPQANRFVVHGDTYRRLLSVAAFLESKDRPRESCGKILEAIQAAYDHRFESGRAAWNRIASAVGVTP